MRITPSPLLRDCLPPPLRTPPPLLENSRPSPGNDQYNECIQNSIQIPYSAHRVLVQSSLHQLLFQPKFGTYDKVFTVDFSFSLKIAKMYKILQNQMFASVL